MKNDQKRADYLTALLDDLFHSAPILPGQKMDLSGAMITFDEIRRVVYEDGKRGVMEARQRLNGGD
jgi:hypothetical protein